MYQVVRHQRHHQQQILTEENRLVHGYIKQQDKQDITSLECIPDQTEREIQPQIW